MTPRDTVSVISKKRPSQAREGSDIRQPMKFRTLTGSPKAGPAIEVLQGIGYQRSIDIYTGYQIGIPIRNCMP